MIRVSHLLLCSSKKEMGERDEGKIAKLIGRIAIYNDSKKPDLCIVLIG